MPLPFVQRHTLGKISITRKTRNR